MAHPKLVSQYHATSGGLSDGIPSFAKKPIPASSTQFEPPIEGQTPSYGSQTVRKVLANHKLSKKAKELVFASWRKNTRSRYDGVLKKWEEFCLRRGENPLFTSIGNVLNFMAERFEEGLGYSSACAARSALNPLVSIEGGGDLTNHPLVSRFVKGVFHLRPPLPRYSEVWDVGMVITYVRGLGRNECMSLRDLTLKTVAILSIVTSQRVSSVAYFSLDQTFFTLDKVIFVPVKLGKHHRQGKKIRKVTIKAYPGDPRVCAVETVRAYIARRRPLSEENQLMVTHRKPYRPASVDTVARWLKQVLNLSGINPAVFGAHSFRGASTSAAKQASIPITKILARGQWASEHTWRRHYDLDVMGYPSSDEEDETTEQLLDAYVE